MEVTTFQPHALPSKPLPEVLRSPLETARRLLTLRWGGLILSIGLLLTVWILLGELRSYVMRAADNALFLAVESVNEMGPKYMDAQKADADLLAHFLEEMAAQTMAPVVSRLWPQYDPQGRLAKALAILQTPAASDEEAKAIIVKASRELGDYARFAYSFSKPEDATLPLENTIAQSYLRRAEESLADFREWKDKFIASPSVLGAEIVCLKSRVVTATYCRGLPEYHNAAKLKDVKQLLHELEELKTSMQQFARSLPSNDPEGCAYRSLRQ